ncbi:Ig-like domain-containing protein [Peribacillus sp. B-H-3]|uniref:Ig-like domain-containing protein n=1 Tax=Peribacillus sp. B-H-3 TaxID=3400420 RepID=UPI003B012AC4
MSKKKAIKLVTASAIAASAFAAVAPTQSHAATSINTVVANAQKSMRAPFDKYYQTGITKKTVPAITVQNLINAGQKAYNDATAAVKKTGGKYAKTNQAKLDSYKKYLERSKAYVSALNEIALIYKQADGAVKAENLGDLKSAEAVLKNASNKGFVGISKVYGPATRDVLKATFTRLSADKLAKVQHTIAKVTSKVESVNAINATTVEVTMKDAVNAKNLDSLHFTIDGLTVTNAAVKQTNDKVVVLTTSVQDGAKEYSVKLNGDTLGFTFKGRSAVLPTSISFVSSSQQAKVGGQVTVKADIGQKVAGVPVTFNIDALNNDVANGSFNKDQVVEVLTNADGIAEYSYTQYANGEDAVSAYATGNPIVRSTAKVYWGLDQRLTITEVTSGNVLANGAKKVYKVSSPENANGYLNVAFKENVNVAPDKLVRGAKVIDVAVGNQTYPYEVTTGGKQEVRVKLDKNGEATFTVTGSDASVTPIVFADGTLSAAGVWSGNDKLDATELQAAAPTVQFALSHSLGLDVKGEGTSNAAGISDVNAPASAPNNGGRKYTVTVTDKDGKLAPAGTKAYVTFADGSYSTDKTAYILNADGTNRIVANKNARFEITVGKEGKATFILRGQRDAFAAPTVYLDNGSELGNGTLDKADLQVVGETTYFVNATVTNATLTVTDGTDEVTSVQAGKLAYFEYQSVDQNGFDYYVGDGSYEVSYQVTANFADVTVSGTFEFKVVKKGTTETVKVQSDRYTGKAELRVGSENVASNVTVQASASQISLPNKTASVSFTANDGIPAYLNGTIEWVNKDTEKLKFVDSSAEINYSDSTFYLNGRAAALSKAEFNDLISDGDKVVFTKGTNGAHKFEIIDNEPGTGKTGPDVNVAPRDVAADKNVAVTGSLSLDVDQLATDADGDKLSFTGNATSSNGSVARASYSGETLTVLPAMVGTSTITINVTDGHGHTVPVQFDVTVTAGGVTVANFGKPTVAYGAPVPTAATSVIATPTVTTAGSLNITVDGTTSISVPLAVGSTLAQIAAAINSAANTAGLADLATVTGNDVTLTSPTTGVNSDIVRAGDGTLDGTNIAASVNATNGTSGTATAAKYAFGVNSPFVAGQTLTVKIGEQTKTLTAVSSGASTDQFNINASTSVTAANIANALSLTDYTVTASGNNVVLTQKTPAATTGVTLTTTVSN